MNEKIHSTSSRFRIENATIGYDKTVISEDISVEIPHNSFTAIIGPNGCGKSTLLRALARVLVPVKGRVMLDDQNISKYKTQVVEREFGLLLQISIALVGIRIVVLMERWHALYL